MNEKEMLNKLPVFIFTKDAEAKLDYVNQHALDAFDVKLDENLDENIKKIVGDEAYEKYHKDDMQVLESGEPLVGIEDKVTLKDGSSINVIASRIPIKDVDGKVIGIFGIAIEK